MTIETIIQWLGGLLAYTTLGIILFGVWRGSKRQAGRTTGLNGAWLRSPWFYLASASFFFGICYFAWIPLPQTFSPQARAWMLALGSLLYFPGMSFTLWGRLVLGKNYFVSTGFGAQLFEGHQLVTRGPFAIVRHPMYSGLILAALGALLLYSSLGWRIPRRSAAKSSYGVAVFDTPSACGGVIHFTWTTLYFACFALLLTVRVRREEAALSAEFGEQWIEYCKRVPALVPRLKR